MMLLAFPLATPVFSTPNPSPTLVKTLISMEIPKLPAQSLRDALKVPFDLLAQMPVVYHLHEKAPDRFKEDKKTVITDFNLLVLVVEKRSTQANNITLQGARADNEGYLLLNYDYAKEAGLITEQGNFRGNPSTDTFTYQSKKYTIVDVEPVGQLVDTFTALKIYYKT